MVRQFDQTGIPSPAAVRLRTTYRPLRTFTEYSVSFVRPFRRTFNCHIVDLQGGTEGDVAQSTETALHDDVARRRILSTCEKAAKPGDLDEVSKEGSGWKRMGSWIGDQAIEEARLQLGHDRFHPEGAVAGKPTASDRLRFQINPVVS